MEFPARKERGKRLQRRGFLHRVAKAAQIGQVSGVVRCTPEGGLCFMQVLLAFLADFHRVAEQPAVKPQDFCVSFDGEGQIQRLDEGWIKTEARTPGVDAELLVELLPPDCNAGFPLAFGLRF